MAKQKLSKFEIPYEKLRWTCDCDVFGCQTTETATPLDGILGQSRALQAIDHGLHIKSPGYNIYVAGVSGSGKTSTAKAMLRKMQNTKTDLQDVIYVNNFKDPRKPHCIKIPSGKARAFRQEMKDLIDTLQEVISNIFEHEDYKEARNTLIERHRDRQKEIFRKLEEKIKKDNFTMVHVQMGPYTRPMILPLIENQPVQFDHLESLAANGNFPKETLKRLKAKHQVLFNELEDAMKVARGIEKELKKTLADLEKGYGGSVIEEMIKDIRERFPYEPIGKHLDEVLESILDNLNLFKEEESQPQQAQAMGPMLRADPQDDDRFSEYRVNIIVDNSETKGVPVIIENTPNHKNLFGTIEKAVRSTGHWTTDFMKITSGSLLRADGGYLVINLLDAVTEPGVWKTLKRTLRSRQMEIESFDSMFFFTASAMKPEPVDVDVKIVAIGDGELYHVLYQWDDDFKKIFKVKADFDHIMEKNQDYIVKYASFVHKIVTDEKLRHFHSTGISAVVEEGVRMSGNQEKLTARFSVIADVVREASFHADRGRSKYVKPLHVHKAIQARRERMCLIEDKLGEMIRNEKILISSTGTAVGQVNGLGVYSLGDYQFGKPSRITAQVSMGRRGIINIEREAKLSGRIHDKGMLILSGFMRGRYAQHKPLTLSASICFEQSYGGVDGDSASAAEIYALLSCISGIPIKQSFAVTGSVNQYGQIQPIGGVNEKIEGFFKTCKDRRLTGNQGVVIPVQNIPDLMVNHEVATACKAGRFHVYAVSSIDEGIELLTGKPAGVRGKSGDYPAGTINALVDERLKNLALDLKDFGKAKDSNKKKSKKIKSK